MARCELTELEESGCAHCNGTDPYYAFPYQQQMAGGGESE